MSNQVVETEIRALGKKLESAINNLNKSTAFLNWIMIGLTGILVWLTFVLIKLPCR